MLVTKAIIILTAKGTYTKDHKLKKATRGCGDPNKITTTAVFLSG
jgi:hypothetical protein